MNFLKENWIWILAPVVVVLIFIVALLMFTDRGSTDDFVYTLN
jgi:ABC-type dipeptide/oligopeptide/nickel transport system permease subunit